MLILRKFDFFRYTSASKSTLHLENTTVDQEQLKLFHEIEESKEENEVIAGAIKENGFSTKKIHFWIGVRDIGNGIHWRVEDQWRLDSNMRKARL